MISISRFSKVIKNNIVIITGFELLPCPKCAGELYCRGTCHRHSIDSSGQVTDYRLRVLKCRECGKTHRELPESLVPYKRYDAATIIIMRDKPNDAPCSPSVQSRILKWLAWFIAYANHIRESQSLILAVTLPKAVGAIQLSSFISLVKIVVNSGFWSHNHSGMT